MSARHGIFVAPFDELSEPGVVADLAARAESRGWDGLFVWDHIQYRAPVRAVADPWITLAAVAVATERMTIGPLVTPLARRRTHKLARETVTLDRLSGGRLVLGVGLGWHSSGEFDAERFGEEEDPRARAALLDDGLERLARYWDGEFEPPPVQQPRIPVWVAGRWPQAAPARAGGALGRVLPDRPARPGGAGGGRRGDRGAARRRDRPLRPRGDQPAGHGPGALDRAGATWCLTGFGMQPTRAEVERAIDAR